ncbi:hypothetical protein THASP1DRAFT_29765 [Thamnocephalis sphaerospora]|uniref:FAD/NAD(P)-binding domain-containing protein n=1 Tax=Thamnocephalis sphaerospora TaxID=78915 RepID=A0A4P9XQV4_9FUNG|nr:hypothetical protein THASP1DRAFT_29765 [Thamnocephalis sphaerospora]|eukprot:RKP08425.1 hypothetical protein THASP1DRAFT_29765 [Thamnocephalis sphaerospora]
MATNDSSSKTRVLVVGGSFAGVGALTELAKHANALNLDVTLVEPRDHHFHNIAFLRAVAQPGFAEKCFIPLANAPFLRGDSVHHERSRVREAHVDRIVLEDGRELSYDYLVLATGSRYGVPSKVNTDVVEEGVAALKEALAAVQKAKRIVVVGGGAVGIELAGELKQNYPDSTVTIVSAENQLLANPPALADKLRAKLLAKLTAFGVHVVLGRRITLTAEQRAAGYVAGEHAWELDNGETIEADLLFSATGHTGLNTDLAQTLGENVVNPETSEIRVRPTSQLQAHDHIFAVGDCADLGSKLAFLAGAQGALSAENIIRLVRAQRNASSTAKLSEFKTLNACMVTIGSREGAAQLPGIGVIGRTLVKMLKGKDFMLKRTYNQLAAKPQAD